MKKILLAFVLVGSAAAQAAPARQITRAEAVAEIRRLDHVNDACSGKAIDNPTISGCLSDHYEALDKLLNKVYQQKMSSLSPAKREELRREERKFVAAKTAAAQDVEMEGAEGPIEALSSDVAFTEKRILELLK